MQSSRAPPSMPTPSFIGMGPRYVLGLRCQLRQAQMVEIMVLPITQVVEEEQVVLELMVVHQEMDVEV